MTSYRLCFLLPLVCGVVNASFFGHLSPASYRAGDILDVHAGQLVSPRTAYPFDFYKLAWCPSTKGHEWDPDTVGQSIRDVEKVESPFSVSFNSNLTVNYLCSMNLDTLKRCSLLVQKR